MKITRRQLKQLIKEAIRDSRPWWHGPFESDWDKKNKELCDLGDEEACKKNKPRWAGPTDDEWEKAMKRLGLHETKIKPLPGEGFTDEEIGNIDETNGFDFDGNNYR